MDNRLDRMVRYIIDKGVNTIYIFDRARDGLDLKLEELFSELKIDIYIISTRNKLEGFRFMDNSMLVVYDYDLLRKGNHNDIINMYKEDITIVNDDIFNITKEDIDSIIDDINKNSITFLSGSHIVKDILMNKECNSKEEEIVIECRLKDLFNDGKVVVDADSIVSREEIIGSALMKYLGHRRCDSLPDISAEQFGCVASCVLDILEEDV